jgi:hypothetical protein
MLAVLLASAAAVTLAAEPVEVSCRGHRSTNPPVSKKLTAGFELRLRSSPNAPGETCEATLVGPGGTPAFRITHASVVLDTQGTGLDFDGDGEPELVLQVDDAGGNHCCWSELFISLSPSPHTLFELPADGAMRFEQQPHGVLIWQRVGGPSGYTSMAARPYAEKVFRMKQGALVDVTPELAGRLFSEENEDFREARDVLTPQRLDAFQHGELAPDEPDNEALVSALLAQALQHVFCHQFEAARANLDRWPAASRAKLQKDFAAVLAADYPAFEASLRGKRAAPQN